MMVTMDYNEEDDDDGENDNDESNAKHEIDF